MTADAVTDAVTDAVRGSDIALRRGQYEMHVAAAWGPRLPDRDSSF